jgi:hypothetical protein
VVEHAEMERLSRDRIVVKDDACGGAGVGEKVGRGGGKYRYGEPEWNKTGATGALVRGIRKMARQAAAAAAHVTHIGKCRGRRRPVGRHARNPNPSAETSRRW